MVSLRTLMVATLSIALIGLGATSAMAQIDDDFEDDFGDEFDDDFDEFPDDDFDDDFDDDLATPLDEPAARIDADDELAPLTLGEGEIRIDGVFEISLSSGSVFEPFSIAPDIYYGLSDELTLGVIHSGFGTTGFFGGLGNGLCLTGEDGGCPNVYDNVGARGLFGLLDGDIELVADGGVFVRSFSDDLELALKLGVLGRWVSGDIQVLFNPNLFIGLSNRDINPDTLYLPVTALYALTPEISAGAQTGLLGQLNEFGDTWFIPLSLVGSYSLSENLGVAASLSLPQLFGEFDTTDIRSLNVFVTYTAARDQYASWGMTSIGPRPRASSRGTMRSAVATRTMQARCGAAHRRSTSRDWARSTWRSFSASTWM
jgi:hypothetical protein